MSASRLVRRTRDGCRRTAFVGFAACLACVSCANHAGPVASPRIVSASPSELVVDIGQSETRRIPYSAITAVVYGPNLDPLVENGVRRWGRVPSKYPWSGSRHQFARHLLKIVFADDGQQKDVVLAIDPADARRTLETVERNAGRAVEFEVVEACLLARTAAECGYGTPAELRGLKRIFIDTPRFAADERVPGDGYAAAAEMSHNRIAAALTGARAGLSLVGRVEDAEMILVFRSDSWREPSCMPLSVGYGPDWGAGEVYVRAANGLRLVMTFDRECSVWRRWPASTFAESFVRAYRQANGLK